MSERKGTKALELWCRRLLSGYNGVSVDNMTTSWKNGLAFCALVHRFRPDLIDFASLKPDDVYYNNELAFRTAETHLGIPALLDPEDMVDSDIPDRLSILTYLSQFYQRLGHTVTKSPTDNNNEVSTPPSPKSPLSPLIPASLKLGKMSSEVCTSCGMPVYLAQRLIVSRKLYHRSCFRCVTCNSQLNHHACYENANGTEFCCETCKNAQELPPLQEEDDRMGMVMFHDDEPVQKPLPSIIADTKVENHSISDKIKLFERNIDKSDKVPEIRRSWRYTDQIDGKNSVENDSLFLEERIESAKTDDIDKIIQTVDEIPKIYDAISVPDSIYKSNINKLSFLQTQLSTDLDMIDGKSESTTDNIERTVETNDNIGCDKVENESNIPLDKNKINSNVPDDELEEKMTQSCKIASVDDKREMKTQQDDSCIDIAVVIPPRRKKSAQNRNCKESPNKSNDSNVENKSTNVSVSEYPEHLNPFSDDELEEDTPGTTKLTKVSTNPFGSSDEDDEPDIKVTPVKIHPPRKSEAPSSNPFWSDGEEPSPDEEESHQSFNKTRMYDKSHVTSSTPNLPSTKVKPKAPKPPVITLHKAPVIEIENSYSMNDEASLSSLSSHCSTVNSETKPSLRLSPKYRKKRPAPTPPDNTSLVSTLSTAGRPNSLIQGKHLFADEPYSSIASEGTWHRVKGPAPGLPLPGRRVVRPELTPAELQNQLDLLETQQLGLEKQGVLIEQMIRDKCEGEEAATVPAEEVEDLVIQLCELVNEKNDLFRKQAELMYIRRQQRLEQEQADIEHEIRVIQSRPAVNRMDADKAREEQLVARLVDVVRLRDELVQQLDKERRRERAEDEAIALTIAQRRAQRSSGSINSTLQSEDTVQSPKKSKVKDKMKKQIRKAKITLHLKKEKKDSGDTSKDSNGEKKEKNVKSTK